MKTKFIIFILLFSISVNQITAQNNKKDEIELANYRVHIFPDAFLVGTFSDYLGRYFNIEKETQIDKYAPNEKSLAKYVSFFVENNYKIKNELVIKNDNSLELFIPNLAKRLNTTFYFENGYLLDDKFRSEEEKLSFLLGVYYRYGEQLKDNIYQIKLINTPKQKTVYSVLKELDCEKIVFNSEQNTLPQIFTFYFVATPKMIKYFEYLKQEKAQLEFESISFVGENNKFEDTRKQKQKNKNELVKNLEYIFK